MITMLKGGMQHEGVKAVKLDQFLVCVSVYWWVSRAFCIWGSIVDGQEGCSLLCSQVLLKGNPLSIMHLSDLRFGSYLPKVAISTWDLHLPDKGTAFVMIEARPMVQFRMAPHCMCFQLPGRGCMWVPSEHLAYRELFTFVFATLLWPLRDATVAGRGLKKKKKKDSIYALCKTLKILQKKPQLAAPSMQNIFKGSRVRIICF